MGGQAFILYGLLCIVDQANSAELVLHFAACKNA